MECALGRLDRSKCSGVPLAILLLVGFDLAVASVHQCLSSRMGKENYTFGVNSFLDMIFWVFMWCVYVVVCFALLMKEEFGAWRY